MAGSVFKPSAGGLKETSVIEKVCVFMGPVKAAKGTGVMLLSGDPEQCARVLPDLERMTGRV